MAITGVMFDTAADPGEKLDVAVRAEIDELAPSTIDTGDIHTNMLADEAVTKPKLFPGSVDQDIIAAGGVATGNIAPGAVTTDQLGDEAITAAKAGTGVVTAYDQAGNPIESKDVYLSAAQYNLISVPDPNTTYNIVG